MNDTSTKDVPGALDALVAAAQGAKGKPPVHLWNPSFCGAIDMRIAADGTWFYQGTPIGRQALVQLFASVLKYEAEEGRHVLVTPVEKVAIEVEDAPFLAVEMRREEGDEPRIAFRTNVDDWVLADAEHPLTFERDAEGGIKPYLLVRHGLRALVSRALMYDLVDLGEVKNIEGVESLALTSCGADFVIAPASEMDSPS
ncbi:hypothetical protein GCM10007276_16630 [Agaricicola taiwanensis]|uniref:DUF1285 domain-containing protein n=1 Tax=Agaricicola taiwanensis TaxID=591372 RepID=A0A8J2VXI0_9RHOB|nr:DUF1285 domain-containing protein [Agaricicola taiwanensis]GGE39985.1 hypothetical protein GCM10007276_16630 [Agaricicola taiwanensis]